MIRESATEIFGEVSKGTSTHQCQRVTISIHRELTTAVRNLISDLVQCIQPYSNSLGSYTLPGQPYKYIGNSDL